MNRPALLSRVFATTALVAGLASGALASDGNNRVIWQNQGTGQYSLDVVDNFGAVLSYINFGPYNGWALQNIATGSDNTTRVLFQQRFATGVPSGLASVVFFGAGGSFIGSTNVGPYPGWAPMFLAIGHDNIPRILWSDATGKVSATWIDVVMGGTATISHSYNAGPYPGWETVGMDVGGDNVTRMFWAGSDNSAAVVQIDPTFNFLNSFGLPAIANMVPRGATVGGDNLTRFTFASSDNHALSLLTVNDLGQPAGSAYNAGPYTDGFGQPAPWKLAGAACGADNMTRVAWLNTSTGLYSVHFLNAAGSFIYYRNLGPYTSWVPVGASEPK